LSQNKIAGEIESYMKFMSKNRNRFAQFSRMDSLESRRLLAATVTAQIPAQTVTAGQTAALTLSSYFEDNAVTAGDTVVNLQTNLPAPDNSIPLMLTNSATPQTVANFLQYITSGEYANTIIHRSVPGFVIQGGGYDTNGTLIASTGTIPGESSTATLKNTTGTIAMALSTGPNSATSEWYINLGNNSELDNSSDGGPFTAFGQVLYNGLQTADAIAALPIVDDTANDAWNTIPVQGPSSENGETVSSIPNADFVILNPVIVPGGLTYTVSSDQPGIATGSITNGQLTISSLSSGTAHLTVTATDLGGGTASSVFAVTVPAPIGTVPSVTTITPSAHSFVVGQNNPLAISVASADGTGAVPTGSVSLYQDGTLQGTYDLNSTGQASVSLAVTSADPSAVLDAVYNGDSTYASSTSSNITQVYLPASSLTLSLAKISLPANAVAGANFGAHVTAVIANSGAAVSGKFSVALSADIAGTGLDSTPVVLSSIPKKLTIKTGKTASIVFNVKSLSPSMDAGTYHLVAELTDPTSDNALATTTQTTTVAAPVIDLSGTFSKDGVTVTSGKKSTVTVIVTNSSSANINASGKLPVVLYASPDQNISDGTAVGNVSKPVDIKPGASKKISVPVTISAGDAQFIFAVLDPNSTAFPDDVDAANNTFDVPLSISSS
jgi:cyclophilin family peptidyl-prolyl cis-trans isomerase/uncharacterized cupredoxin-like copper-binding protein